MTGRLVTTLSLAVALLGGIGMVVFAVPPPELAAPIARCTACQTDHRGLPEHKGEFWATTAHRPRSGSCCG
jgi:hypothetical protein